LRVSGEKPLTVQMEHVGEDGSWDPDELHKMKDNCDRAVSISKRFSGIWDFPP